MRYEELKSADPDWVCKGKLEGATFFEAYQLSMEKGLVIASPAELEDFLLKNPQFNGGYFGSGEIIAYNRGLGKLGDFVFFKSKEGSIALDVPRAYVGYDGFVFIDPPAYELEMPEKRQINILISESHTKSIRHLKSQCVPSNLFLRQDSSYVGPAFAGGLYRKGRFSTTLSPFDLHSYLLVEPKPETAALPAKPEEDLEAKVEAAPVESVADNIIVPLPAPSFTVIKISNLDKYSAALHNAKMGADGLFHGMKGGERAGKSVFEGTTHMKKLVELLDAVSPDSGSIKLDLETAQYQKLLSDAQKNLGYIKDHSNRENRTLWLCFEPLLDLLQSSPPQPPSQK